MKKKAALLINIQTISLIEVSLLQRNAYTSTFEFKRKSTYLHTHTHTHSSTLGKSYQKQLNRSNICRLLKKEEPELCRLSYLSPNKHNFTHTKTNKNSFFFLFFNAARSINFNLNFKLP